LVILGFTRAQTDGFTDPWSWLSFALIPMTVMAFISVERGSRAPLVPRTLWSIPSFLIGMVIAAVLTATTSGANIVGSLFLQNVLKLSAGSTGGVFLLFSLSVVAGSTVASAAITRFGPVRAMTAGLGVVTLSMAAQATAVSQRGLLVFLAGLGLSG